MKILTVMMAILLVVSTEPEPEPEPFSRYSPPYRPGYSPSYYHPPYYSPAYQQPPYYQPLTYPSRAYGPYYKKDYYCDPKKAPNCALNTTRHYCLEDSEYPEYDIKYAVDYDPLVLKKYAEVADQSADDLVDHVTKVQEDEFNYAGYNGATFERGNWIGGEGYICPSEVLYARPLRAANIDDEWRVIVQNVAYYTQTQRIETCLFPGASCRTLAPCYRSQCVQKYVYHRMLSYDPCDPYKGLFIDIYKFPSACSCHVPAL